MSASASLSHLLAILLILPLIIEGAGDSQRALCTSDSGLCSLHRRDLLQITSRTRKPKKGKNKPSTETTSIEVSPQRTPKSPVEKDDADAPQEDTEPDRVVLVAIPEEIEVPEESSPPPLPPRPPPPTQGRGGANNRTQTTRQQATGADPEAGEGVSLLDIISGRTSAPETEGSDPQVEFEFPEGVELELEGFTPSESLPPPTRGGPNIVPPGIQGGQSIVPPGIQGGPGGSQYNIQGGPAGFQRGGQGGPAGFQRGEQGGIPRNSTGVRTGPTFLGDEQGGTLPNPASGSPGGFGSLPTGPGGQTGDPPGERPLNLTAKIIEPPPEGEDAEFFGHVNADLCPCSDAVPSGAFNCMQVRFQEECSLRSILKGPADVPEGFCEVTCGRCDCCTDMLTMSSRRGLDTFRKIFQTMADAEGSRSIARSLQNPSFATTVFAPTNDAFSRMLHLLNMTVDDFLEQPSLMNQVMTYHVLLGPTATSSEELSTGFLGTTLPTVNSAAFVSLNTSGPILGVGAIGSYANVLVPDVFSCKSIFHVVDEVLLPFSPKGFQGR